jgi:hypothetical protein
MPVENYGVLIGPYLSFHRDPPNNEGKYLHGHVVVGAGGLQIDCAVDCNHSTLNVNYLHLTNLDASKLGPVTGMPDGYHALPTLTDPAAPTGGALDYKRDPLIAAPLGCGAIFLAILDRLTGRRSSVWQTNVGDSAVAALQSMVTGAPIDRVFVFGAKWENSNQSPPWGMHDIHCNQGDPPGAFQYLDGIWQDGGVIVRRPDGSYDGFIVMFTSQTLDTNDATGLPN